MTRKMIAGMAAGLILLGGGLSYTYAEQNDGSRPERMERGQFGRHQPMHMDKEKAAASIADAFQVNRDEVLEAMNSNADFRDVGHAAMLAKVSGKSFKDVLAMKTQSNRWGDVRESLGVTREQMKDVMDSLTARRIAEGGNVDSSQAEALLKEGYFVQDIEAAGILAKASGKDIRSVLSMKKINNRWWDVAKSLGVDAKVLRDGMRGPCGPGGMMGGPGPMGWNGAPDAMDE